MNTILVPTDFSDTANNALEYSAGIARASDATITVLHVLTDIQYFDNQEMNMALREALERLQHLCGNIREKYSEVGCGHLLKIGETVMEIVKTASELKADMIIMGTKGASEFSKRLLGSNTESVIEKSTCPVLSVPFNSPFKTPERILFATNFTYEDVANAQEVVRLAQCFNATIIIAHIKLFHEEINTKKAIRDFSNEVSRRSNYPNILYKVFSDNTAIMGIERLIETTKADMLVLSTRRRTLLEKFFNPSITKKFSLHSNIPLLAFHYLEELSVQEME